MARDLAEGFKVGAVVAVLGGYHSGTVLGITKIDKIGKVHLTIAGSVAKYRLDGWQVSHKGYPASLIVLATPEHARELKRRRMLTQIDAVRWHDLDVETLSAVVAALDRYDATKRDAEKPGAR